MHFYRMAFQAILSTSQLVYLFCRKFYTCEKYFISSVLTEHNFMDQITPICTTLECVGYVEYFKPRFRSFNIIPVGMHNSKGFVRVVI